MIEKLVDQARRVSTQEDLEHLLHEALRHGLVTPRLQQSKTLFFLYDEKGKRITTKAWSELRHAMQAALQVGDGLYRVQMAKALVVGERRYRVRVTQGRTTYREYTHGKWEEVTDDTDKVPVRHHPDR